MLFKNLRAVLIKINKGNGVMGCNRMATSAVHKEEKIKIRDHNINYLKIGFGPHNVLCMPGALGSIWTDFKPQVEGFNREKFTLVAWDPPGYGKSRPPNKKFDEPLFYNTDADYAYELMKALELPKYSLLGWSDGGITSMIHAAKYPAAVQKMVIWGSNSFILPHELDLYKNIRDVNKWSKKMREPMEEVYGDFFAQYWSDWVDAMIKIYNTYDENICNGVLKDIKCPTFILYGEKDPMVDNVHASHLHTHIQGSRLHLYPEGKHNIHIRYAEDFNKRVQEFLVQ